MDRNVYDTCPSRFAARTREDFDNFSAAKGDMPDDCAMNRIAAETSELG
jgi:hypothetical protein